MCLLTRDYSRQLCWCRVSSDRPRNCRAGPFCLVCVNGGWGLRSGGLQTDAYPLCDPARVVGGSFHGFCLLTEKSLLMVLRHPYSDMLCRRISRGVIGV